MRKYTYCLLLTLSSILISNTLSAQSNQAARKLQLAEFAISRLYVDEVNEEELVEKAITSMLEELDPHSTYTNAEGTTFDNYYTILLAPVDFAEYLK